jgi:hypothetical protein
VKRIIIGLILGSLLALNAGSLAAARIVDLRQLDAELYPDTQVSLTVIDPGPRQSVRLRAIDAMFYPDSLGLDDRWQMPTIEYTVTLADWHVGCE